LETEVSYDNLVIFRKIANTIAMKEKEIETKTQQGKGFFGRFFGGGSKQTTEVEEVHDEDVWKEVYNAVGYTEKSEDDSKTVYPKEVSELKFHAGTQSNSGYT
jgi:hypothetical protein